MHNCILILFIANVLGAVLSAMLSATGSRKKVVLYWVCGSGARQAKMEETMSKCKECARSKEWDNVLATSLLIALTILSITACGLGLGVLAILHF